MEGTMSTLPRTLQIGPFVYSVYADLEKIKDEAAKTSVDVFVIVPPEK